jgi:hypothetical protein
MRERDVKYKWKHLQIKVFNKIQFLENPELIKRPKLKGNSRNNCLKECALHRFCKQVLYCKFDPVLGLLFCLGI